MVKDYKNKKQLYHLTAMGNLPSIFQDGLKSRSSLNRTHFNDVADPDILASRQGKGLEAYVPFHFFSKTPFDYAVLHNNPATTFVLLAVRRDVAKANDCSHPLCGASPDLMDYEPGFNAINWDLMQSDQYTYGSHPEYKQTCMAECLSPVTVSASSLQVIYVKNEADKKTVEAYRNAAALTMYVDVAPAMFAR